MANLAMLLCLLTMLLPVLASSMFMLGSPDEGSSRAPAEARRPGRTTRSSRLVDPALPRQNKRAEGLEPESHERGGPGKPQRRRDVKEPAMIQFDPPTLLVSSIGGCGTTSLMEALANMGEGLVLNDIHDRDGIKHVPFQRLPASRLVNLKGILYLTCNVTHSILSLWRRQFFISQAKKTRSEKYPGNQKITIQDYAGQPDDRYYQVAKHLRSFLAQCKFPVAYMDVRYVGMHMQELVQFIGIPQARLEEGLAPWLKDFEEYWGSHAQLPATQPSGAPALSRSSTEDYGDLEGENGSFEEDEEQDVDDFGDMDDGDSDPSLEVSDSVIRQLKDKFRGVQAVYKRLGQFHVQPKCSPERDSDAPLPSIASAEPPDSPTD